MLGTRTPTVYRARVPQFAEFEEKEFEGPLNTQLCLGTPMWSPGQVLEAIVGFDVALMVQDSVFWGQQGFAALPQGAAIHSSWWHSAIAHLAVQVPSPPSFRLNLFLQYKRPQYLHVAQAGEWSDWQKAYYRFRTMAHQQSALDACAQALGANGLVAYASPAFHSRVALYRHVEHRTLRANTHFAPASRLTGHELYTYVDATTPGKAHSEVVKVEPLRFLSGGNGGGPPPGPRGDGGNRQPAELLADARRAAAAAIAASSQVVGNAALFRAAVQRAAEFLRTVFPPVPEAYEPPVQDFIFAATFSSMSGVGWRII
ncbi:hypothetical protein SAMN05443639_113173 [Stigmatella erecta]|uniref:Uncharacterized protein n=1 Tax=Stigmatella erecta TaxID=83460 RepID=A0A1I0KTI9_9BACT|nr:hypothetical protein SAMN05443639_113173 [Stigmatella erecta]